MAEPFPALPIRLVVSDVDGTLVTRDKRLTERTQAAIAALRERGVAFTIISARPPLGVHRLVERLDLAGPVGAVNGGALIRKDLTIVERKFVDPAAARAAVAFLRERGIDPWLFTETEWFLGDPNGAHVDHEAKTLAMHFAVVDAFSDAAYAHVLKIVGASHDHPHLARCETDLQVLLGDTASATRSQAYYLDVTHPEAIKGNGLAGLARLLGLETDCVMALGDGVNDISMLQRAGFSVAMANGSDPVRAAASAVTDDCDADGFAKAIERYVLADPRVPARKPESPRLHEDLAASEDAPR
jgi:Cof subfamily protein (haloacid dehalogenase superfamily)